MVDEKITRRIDSTGRVSIPKHLRDKFGCFEGEEVEFFTEGEFICIRSKSKQED